MSRPKPVAAAERALPTLRLTLPVAALAELPMALLGAVTATAGGWLFAALQGRAPLMPALAGLTIGVCASQLRVQRRSGRAVLTLAAAGLSIGLAGALEAPLPRLALVVLALSLAAGAGTVERPALVATRVGLAGLVTGLLCASLARAVDGAPTLLVCAAAAAPVFVGCWLVGRVELRLEAPRPRHALGPYR